MPADNHNTKTELNTWQEIADYLDVTSRTAQTWAKDRGLPVRKVGGRVSATKTELEEWKREQKSPIRVEPAPTMTPEEVPPLPSPPPPTPAHRPVSAFRASNPALIILAGIFTTVAIALSFYWFTYRLGEPSSYTIEGRLLTVFDEHNQRLWEYVFPAILTPVDLIYQKHTGAQWPNKFADLSGTGHINFLISVYGLLYCFDHNGRVMWTQQVGREVVSDGRLVPANYTISLLDALSKPARGGGRIVVGASRGPGALYIVELLDKDGKKVSEYFHFGWFFAIKTGALDMSGHEDIFLAGVDGVSSNSTNYGATLVALDPEHASGQATTFINDPRALKDIPAAREKAIVLVKEFEPPPEAPFYCYGKNLVLSIGFLEMFVFEGGELRGAHFRFNRKLQLDGVSPELRLLNTLRATILNNVPPVQWSEVINRSLGDVRYVRNEFK